MKSKLLFLLLGLVAFTATFAQTTYPLEDWVSTAGSQNFFYKNVTKTYGIDTYVAGATVNDSGNYDILVIKYNSAGSVAWTKQYNGGGNGNDMAADMIVDANGVFVVGTSYINGTNSQDGIIIKYNTSGTQQWIKTYNGTGSSYDGFTSLCTNGTDRIYTGGGSFGTGANSDYVVNSFRISDGNQMWVSRYNSTYNLHDLPTKITYTTTGSPAYPITISGGMQYTTTNWKFGTVTYNTSGTLGSATLSGTNSDGLVRVTDITTDASGNTFITGGIQNSGQYDWRTIKLNSSLTELWAVEYDGGSSLEDVAMGIKEKSGSVYVTGFATVTGQGRNIVTKKYNGSTGATLWTQTYNGSTNGNDEGGALVIDGSSNIYVGGTTNNGINSDFITTKYNSSGTQQWQLTYNSVANTDDKISDIALNGSDVVVTGQSGVGSSLNYLTVKYVQKSLTLPPDSNANSTTFPYIENRGQVFGTNGVAQSGIGFVTETGSPKVYLNSNVISYVLAKTNEQRTVNDTLFRIDATFNKTRANKIYGLNKRNDFHNFYTGRVSGHLNRVPMYDYVVLPDLYSNVDLVAGSNKKGFKYYLVCKPGFTTSSIEIEYSGQSSISINGSGDLVLTSSIGTVTQPKARAFQIDGSGNYVSLGWQPTYVLTGNKLTFTLGSYTTTQRLVIVLSYGNDPADVTATRPTQDWSTYYGGSDIDRARDIATDSDGNSYITGGTMANDFPITTGQTITSNTMDAFVVKFKPDATRDWALLVGGPDRDEGMAMAINKGISSDDNLIIAGNTDSNVDSDLNTPALHTLNTIPVSGAYAQNFNAGETDAFVFRMAKIDGAIKILTPFGGDESQFVNSISTDSDGNIYLYGKTEYSANVTDNPCAAASSTDKGFPLCDPSGGAYFQGTHAGNIDMFISRFSKDFVMDWSTYFGGSGEECNLTTGECAVVGSTKEFLITGSTNTGTGQVNSCNSNSSGNFPLCSPVGAYNQSTFGGGNDGFIAKFNASRQLVWSTYFGGNGSETSQTITVKGSDAYIAGTTGSSNATFPLLSLSGAFNDNTNAGSADLFIAKFNSSNQQVWGTFYGSNSEDIIDTQSPNGDYDKQYMDLAVDANNNTYLAALNCKIIGFTAEFPVVNNANLFNQATRKGNTYQNEITLLRFNSVDNVDWATYYSTTVPLGSTPGDRVVGAAIATFTDNYLYLTGYAREYEFHYQCPPGVNPWCRQLAIPLSSDPFQTYDATIARFYVYVAPTVGIDEPEVNTDEIKIYPNPTEGSYSISISNISKEDISISLYDIQGKLIENNVIKPTGESILLQKDISALSKGVYLMTITTESRVKTFRIVKI